MPLVLIGGLAYMAYTARDRLLKIRYDAYMNALEDSLGMPRWNHED